MAAKAYSVSCNSIIEDRLHERAKAVEDYVKGHVLSLRAPLYHPIDDFARQMIELRAGAHKKAKLLVVLQTPGGTIEVARRIAETLHHHYRRVEYLVPNHAYSAGTVLAMSGDAIHMDNYSVLGPIDPQVKRNNQWVPGLGYIEKFQSLMDKAAKPGGLNTAEMAYLMQNFDPAFLYQIEQERELSITLLKQWLVRYKFKKWTRTRTRKIKVTGRMRSERAAWIAKKLNNTGFWHSHSRGIPMAVARKELDLIIDDFSKDDELNKLVRHYHHLVTDYMQRREHDAALHCWKHYLGISLN